MDIEKAKNDALEYMLYSTFQAEHPQDKLTPEQFARMAEVVDALRPFAEVGYILTGKRLTDE